MPGPPHGPYAHSYFTHQLRASAVGTAYGLGHGHHHKHTLCLTLRARGRPAVLLLSGRRLCTAFVGAAPA